MSGYLVAEIEVTDADAYKLYTARTPDVVARHGGRFVIRGGAPERLEGDWPARRLVVIAFDSLQAARDFYQSADYQEILPLRLAASSGRVALFPGAD